MANPYGTRILSGRLNPRITGAYGYGEEDPLLYDQFQEEPLMSQLPPQNTQWLNSAEAWGIQDPPPPTPAPAMDGEMSLPLQSQEWWSGIDAAGEDLPTVNPTQAQVLPVMGAPGQQVKFDPLEGPDVAAAAQAFAENPQMYPELSGTMAAQPQPALLPNLTANPNNLESGTEDMLRNEVSKLDLQAKAHEAAAASASGLATNPFTVTSGQMKQNLLGSLLSFGVGMAAGGGGKFGLGLGLQGAGDTSSEYFKTLEEKDKEYRQAQLLKAKTEAQAATQAQAQAQGLTKEVAKNQMSMDRLEREDKLISRRQQEGNRQRIAGQKEIIDYKNKVEGGEGLDPAFADWSEKQLGFRPRNKWEAEKAATIQNAATQSKSEDRRGIQQVLGNASALVVGFDMLPNAAPDPQGWNAKQARPIAGANLVVNNLLDDLEGLTKSGNAQEIFGNEGKLREQLAAMIKKADANAETMGANWTKPEMDNILARMPDVEDLYGILKGKALGRDVETSLQSYRNLINERDYDKLGAYGYYKVGHTYSQKTMERMGNVIPVDRNGVAMPSGRLQELIQSLPGADTKAGKVITGKKDDDDKLDRILAKWGL